jgi:hypothetical protein
VPPEITLPPATACACACRPPARGASMCIAANEPPAHAPCGLESPRPACAQPTSRSSSHKRGRAMKGRGAS